MEDKDIQQANENLIYQNIIETQKTQADFIKWKLFASATIGAASMGLYGAPQNGNPNANLLNYLVCLIPLICAYSDAMFFHLWFRIKIIGEYFRTKSDSCFSKYEKEIAAFRANKTITSKWFLIERYAVVGSSLILNLLVLVFGLVVGKNVIIYAIFTVIGIVLTAYFHCLSLKANKNNR